MRLDALDREPCSVHDRRGREPDVTRDELVVAFALTRLDHPALDLADAEVGISGG